MNSALAVCGENPHPVSGALRERMLRLVMPDASGRTVEREGEQVSQWDAEIVPALQEYGNGPSDSHRGLGRGSRHLVQAVRAAGDRVQAGGGWAEAGQLLQELGGEMRQRAVTKYRWLIWGALVNRELVGEDWLLQEVLGWVTDQLGSGEANDPHAVWAGLQGMLSENNSWTTWEGFARAAKQAKTPVDVLPEVVCIYREGHGWYVRPGAVQNRLSNRRDFVGRKEFERVAGYRVGAALKEAGAIDPVVSIRTASGPKKMPVWVVPEQFIRQFDTAAGREAGDSGDSEELPGV